jgi:catechol 2,3-dioxygenase-like lactoylglutathione lyase family enzyme
MPKAVDVSHVIYQATDLDRMATFLTDFGLAPAGRKDGALYMRGTGPAPYIHVTRRGNTNRFIGGAFRVASVGDLEALAKLEGSSPIAPIDAPGGGFAVQMTTPDGVEIKAVCGIADAPALPMRAPYPFNAAAQKMRRNAILRPKREPCPVLRLGHFVLRVTNHDETVTWFRQRFELLPTDYFCVPGDESKIVGTFLHCDCGAEFVDHHSILVIEAKDTGVHHSSFEVQDFDAIMAAHDYLEGRGYRLDCGVGRHLIGSQIFDYWLDPFGFRLEHYTDGDVVNKEFRPGRFAGTADETTQWGMNPPREFFE